MAEEKAEKARKKAKLPVPKPRLFVKPSRKNGLLNFNATTFDTLFNLDNAPPTEIRVPPALANFTLKNFKDLYKSDTDIIELPDIPVHSQNVERWVQNVQNAKYAQKTTHTQRFGRVLLTHHARQCGYKSNVTRKSDIKSTKGSKMSKTPHHKCPICKKTYPTFESLGKHVVTHNK